MPQAMKIPDAKAAVDKEWEKLVKNDISRIPTEPPADPHTDEQLHGNLLQDYDRKFEQPSDNQKISKLCSDAAAVLGNAGPNMLVLSMPTNL